MPDEIIEQATSLTFGVFPAIADEDCTHATLLAAVAGTMALYTTPWTGINAHRGGVATILSYFRACRAFPRT
jgi:hypothetical protein